MGCANGMGSTTSPLMGSFSTVDVFGGPYSDHELSRALVSFLPEAMMDTGWSLSDHPVWSEADRPTTRDMGGERGNVREWPIIDER